MGEDDFDLVDETFDGLALELDSAQDRPVSKAAVALNKEARRRLEEHLEQRRLDKLLGDYDFDLDLD